MAEELTKWIVQQIEMNGWSMSELARRAGLSTTTISDVLAEKANPGTSFCNGVARALGVPPERVFRIAGLLPPVVIGQNEEKRQELDSYWVYLSEEERDTITAMARMLYERRVTYQADKESPDTDGR